MFLALPIRARSPVLSAVGDITKSNVQVRARLEGEEAAVEVTFICETTILVDSAPETDLGAAA
jgi:hypothetical protein